MSDKTLPVNTLVIAGRNLGVITKVGRHAGADGCWIASSTGDPGASAYSLPSFAQWWHVKAAVVGETVCPEPRGTHWCGLTHVSAEVLARLPHTESGAS